MAVSVPFTGGCACGAIRYECSAEPLRSMNCHCRNCQHTSGGGYFPEVLIPIAALKITGDVKYYDVKADSGNTLSHGFCAHCGAPVFAKSSGFPDFMIVRVGSLDDPSWYQPDMDVYTSRAQPWDYMNPDLPKFPEMTW